MTLKFNRLSAAVKVVKVHVLANYHQAECSSPWVIVLTNFLPYRSMVKNPKIRSCDLDLWPMILKFNRDLEVSKVCTKYHQPECSGSWVIVLTNFLPNLAMVKNSIIRSCDLDLCPMTLKCNGVRAVVKLSLIHIWRCRRSYACRSRWSPYH